MKCAEKDVSKYKRCEKVLTQWYDTYGSFRIIGSFWEQINMEFVATCRRFVPSNWWGNLQPRFQGLPSYRPWSERKAGRWETLGTRFLANKVHSARASRARQPRCVFFFYWLVRRGGLIGASRLRIEWPGLYWLLTRHEVRTGADIDQAFMLMRRGQ